MSADQPLSSLKKPAAVSLFVLVILAVIPGLGPIFYGILVPYAAALVFLCGFVYRVVKWARSPVPFRIPTSCGQQKSLPWIKADNLENPFNLAGVIGRMLLEILFFRSLFRNTKASLREGPKISYGGNKVLWLAGLAFHWSLLIILVRHLRFFTEPVPGLVLFVEKIDSIFQIGLPLLCLTDLIILAALTYLLLRRIVFAQIRYISLPADYFALSLLLGIVITGILMRYFLKVDIVAVKELAVGLIGLSPPMPHGIGFLFYLHLFFVSVLLFYFPFSKLMHAGGVFLSPTRNLVNNSRARRHVNPWNYPVKVHTYEEYEEEFHDKMKAAGMPLEKE